MSGRRISVSLECNAQSHKNADSNSDHCIEMLRLAAICRGDTALSTYSWIGEADAKMPTAVDRSPHQCVDWEVLSSWVRGRAVNISEPGVLIRD